MALSRDLRVRTLAFEVALQELDESLYWMELLIESRIVRAERLAPLMQEADELIDMAVTAVKTIKQRRP